MIVSEHGKRVRDVLVGAFQIQTILDRDWFPMIAPDFDQPQCGQAKGRIMSFMPRQSSHSKPSPFLFFHFPRKSSKHFTTISMS